MIVFTTFFEKKHLVSRLVLSILLTTTEVLKICKKYYGTYLANKIWINYIVNRALLLIDIVHLGQACKNLWLCV